SAYYSLNSMPAADSNPLDRSRLLPVRSQKNSTEGVKSKKDAVVAKPTVSIRKKRQLEMPAAWRGGPDKTIVMGTKPGLQFDIPEFAVAPGAKIKLVFNNDDDMQHNVVFVAPGKSDEI